MTKVTTVCPYCASGCKMQLTVEDGKITRADAAMGKNNQGTLCLKGWRPGKQVTEQEYLAAVTAFEKGPMAGTGGTR